MANGHRWIPALMSPSRCSVPSQALLTFCGLAGLLCFCARVTLGQTTFLATFDDGFDAVFAAGEGGARLDARVTSDHIQTVDGRFGKGVFISADAPGLALSYEVAEQLSAEQGTIEFYFKPAWTWAEAPDHVTLFSTYTGGGTGFRILKNQYNWFGLWYSLRYQGKGRAITQYARASEVMMPERWTHVATSWDQDEARLFIDGELVSISDRWEVAGGQHSRFALGCVAYGSGRGAGGTFDELRLSGHKRYVASFVPPDQPLTADAETDTGNPMADGSAQRPADPFTLDLSTPNWQGNRVLPVDDTSGRMAVRLCRSETVDDVLYLRRPSVLNRFLGSVELVARLRAPVQLPAVLFDATDLVFNEHSGRDRGRRTGWRLSLTADARLRWESLEDKQTIGVLQSDPLEIDPSAWHRFGVRWRASRVMLQFAESEVARGTGFGLPSHLPRHIYIGSQSTGRQSLEGWVSHAEIRAR